MWLAAGLGWVFVGGRLMHVLGISVWNLCAVVGGCFSCCVLMSKTLFLFIKNMDIALGSFGEAFGVVSD